MSRGRRVVFLGEMLLNMQADGDIIECGCYAGGSSAKLSIVAEILGRRLAQSPIAGAPKMC
jgi:hypothetical protein